MCFRRRARVFCSEMMDRCQTGKSRIKGLLPQGTDVAHKTGSLGGVANDIGFITLPGDAGHVAISVFTKASNRPEEAAEKAIAEISRTIYDYFVLVPGIRTLMADSWDSALYDDRHSFVWKKAGDLIDLLDPRAGRADPGSGLRTGHLTAQIAARGAAVIGIDSSAVDDRAGAPELSEAQVRTGGRATISDSTNHSTWCSPTRCSTGCPRLARSIASVARALKPEGRFVLEMGGKGNIARIVAVLSAVLRRSGLLTAESLVFSKRRRVRDAARTPWVRSRSAVDDRALEQTRAS